MTLVSPSLPSKVLTLLGITLLCYKFLKELHMQEEKILNIPVKVLGTEYNVDKEVKKLTTIYFKYITILTKHAVHEMQDEDDYIALSRYDDKLDEILEAIRNKTKLSRYALMVELSIIDAYIENFFLECEYDVISVDVSYREANQICLIIALKDKSQRSLLFTFDDNNQIAKIEGYIQNEPNDIWNHTELYNKDFNVLKSNWWEN